MVYLPIIACKAPVKDKFDKIGTYSHIADGLWCYSDSSILQILMTDLYLNYIVKILIMHDLLSLEICLFQPTLMYFYEKYGRLELLKAQLRSNECC